MSTFLQQVINGISLGSIYALIAIGFSLVYGVLGLVNFAHGDIFMLGTYIGYYFYITLGWPIYVAVPIAVVAGGTASVIVERVASRPVRDAPRLIPMITTFGAALVIRNLVEHFAGSNTRGFPTPLTGKAVTVLGIRIPIISLVTIAVAVVTIGAFGAFLKYRKAGYAIRASAQDLTTARLMGVSVERTIIVMFFVGGALGVVGGLLYAASFSAVYVSMGFQGLLKGFAAAVVGGIGNLPGALVGGLLLGVTESIAGPYLSSSYRDAIAFVLLIAILLVRPVGLLGTRVPERV